jgi:membrane associated rhomboid family serine protease
MHLSTTVIIIIITCLVSVTAFYKPDELNKLLLWPAMMRERNQYYRFITSGFVHADWLHLGFNMITLYYFGRIVEVYFRELFGPGVFILFYLIAMVVADLQTYFKYRNTYNYRALGASGAVSAVLFASILFNPWAKIYLFFIPIGIPAFIFGILYLAYCMYMSKRGNDGINHTAHLWGAIFGILFTVVLEPRVGAFFIQQLLG